MKKLFLICLVIALSGFVGRASAQEDEYRVTLEKMMRTSGGLDAGNTIIKQVSSYLKQSVPGVPEVFWEKFVAKWDTKIGSRLVDIYLPIYRKYLSIEDLNQINAFYETPVGKKLAESTPAISSDGMEVGQQLGQEIVGELMQELSDEGYLPQK